MTCVTSAGCVYDKCVNVMVCSWHDTWIVHTGKRGMKGRYPGTGPVHLLAPQHKGKILTATLIRYDTWHFDRLRVVSRFSLRDSRASETLVRVKLTPHEKGETRRGEREKWGTTDKAQVFDPSRPNDFGVWSEVPIAFQIIGKRRVLIAAGAFLTDVDRLPWKSQSELCVVIVVYTLKTKAGSLIVKIKY